MKKGEITNKEVKNLLEKNFSCNHCKKGCCMYWSGLNTAYDVCECTADEFMNAIYEVCDIID